MPISENHHGVNFSKLLPSCSYSPRDFENESESPMLYPRGFLICKQPNLKITPYFSQRPLSHGFYLYTHQLLNIEFGFSSNVRITILGTSFFCDEVKKSNVAQTLAETFSKQGREKFLDTLDLLAGRFIVILETDSEMKIFPDACAMKTVFYSPKNQVAGSHLDLVNMIANADLSEPEKHFREKNYVYTYAFVGNYTKYENIFMLIPDFELSLDDFSTSRFYPRHKITRGKNLYAIKQELFEALQVEFQNLKLKTDKDIAFSITGGFDSRVSFYATQKYNHDCLFLTEDRDADIDIAAVLAKKFELNWIAADIKDLHWQDNKYFHAFNRIVKDKIFPHTSTGALATQFWTMNVIPRQMIHIHSNTTEVGRGRGNDYEFAFLSKDYSFETFYDAYINSTIAWRSDEIKQNQKPMMVSDEKLRAWFRKYFDELDMKKFIDLGYNPWDLMYAEQHCAGMLFGIHQYNDSIFESVSLTNCHRVFEILFQVPEEYVNRSYLLYSCIMNEHDPVNQNIFMGADFKPSPRDLENYALVYGGYLACNHAKSWQRIFDICSGALSVNPTIKWAKDHLEKAKKNLGM